MKKLLKYTLLAVLAIVLIVGALYIYRTRQAIDRVEAYKSEVTQDLSQYGLQGDTQLVLAMIYTETKGGEVDVMQSSESVSGNGQTGTITNQTESIDQGIENLVDILYYAEEKKCDVWTGVQAYNFGKAYVDYVAKNGKTGSDGLKENSTELAADYSRTVVAPSLGNKTGETYTHLTWDSIFYNGGKLYVNGGNFFYAKEVRFNFDLLKIFG